MLPSPTPDERARVADLASVHAATINSYFSDAPLSPAVIRRIEAALKVLGLPRRDQVN